MEKAANLIVSLTIMYVAMFAMIWSWGELVQNVNFLYMALVMWAPMAAVMLLTIDGRNCADEEDPGAAVTDRPTYAHCVL